MRPRNLGLPLYLSLASTFAILFSTRAAMAHLEHQRILSDQANMDGLDFILGVVVFSVSRHSLNEHSRLVGSAESF